MATTSSVMTWGDGNVTEGSELRIESKYGVTETSFYMDNDL